MKCRNDRVRSFYETESHQYSDDAGFDIFCPDDLEIQPGNPHLIDLGIQCYSPEGHAYMLMPRSSIWKKLGLIFLNCTGLIDPGYTGTIKAPVQFFNSITNPVNVLKSFVLVFAWLTIIATNITPIWLAILLNLYGSFLIINIFGKYESCYIKKGEALFQLVAFDGKPIEIEFVDELPETERGDRGFGSTTETKKSI